MGVTEELVEELRALHLGRGVAAPDLPERLGPRLLALVGLPAGVDGARLRSVLVERLRDCTGRLRDAELRSAVETDLGLRHEHLELRERRARSVIDLRWSERTVYRRVDEGRALLAALIATELAAGRARGDGWYLDELDALMRVDRLPITVHENRSIVAARDGVAEVELPFDVPQTEADRTRLSVDVRSGGVVLRTDESRPRRPRTRVGLSRTLARGQRHRLEVDITIAQGRLSRPHYVLIPERTVERARIRVRFDPAALPSWIRRVEAEPVRAFDPPHREGPMLEPDRAGEVAVEFTRPSRQLGYGVQWGPIPGRRWP